MKRASHDNPRNGSGQGASSPSVVVPAHFIKSYLSTGKSWLARTVNPSTNGSQKSSSAHLHSNQNYIRLKYPGGRPKKQQHHQSPNPPPPPPKKVNNFIDNKPPAAPEHRRGHGLYGQIAQQMRPSTSPFETANTNLFSRS